MPEEDTKETTTEASQETKAEETGAEEVATELGEDLESSSSGFKAILEKYLPPITEALRNFFSSIKLSYVLYALGALIFSLFLFLLLEAKHAEEKKKIIGYVKINNKVPEWYKDKKLPAEAQEHLENYHRKKEKELESFKVLKRDKKANKKVLGKVDDAPLTNEKFITILKKQDLGRVTDYSVEKPENMNLSGYDLSQFDYKYFREFIGADLRYTNFSSIEEEGLSFRGSSLRHAQFVESLIPKSKFIRTYLSFSNFYLAVLDESSFIGVSAEKAHFNNARIVAGNFIDAKIIDSDFSETILDQSNFKNAFLRGNNFNDSSLRQTNFKNTQLQASSFVNSDLSGADFSNANLEGADFTGANLKGAKFTGADVTQTKFAEAKNASLEQLNEVKFLLSAKSLPQKIIPKKQSWLERFSAPHDPGK